MQEKKQRENSLDFGREKKKLKTLFSLGRLDDRLARLGKGSDHGPELQPLAHPERQAVLDVRQRRHQRRPRPLRHPAQPEAERPEPAHDVDEGKPLQPLHGRDHLHGVRELEVEEGAGGLLDVLRSGVARAGVDGCGLDLFVVG